MIGGVDNKISIYKLISQNWDIARGGCDTLHFDCGLIEIVVTRGVASGLVVVVDGGWHPLLLLSHRVLPRGG